MSILGAYGNYTVSINLKCILLGLYIKCGCSCMLCGFVQYCFVSALGCSSALKG